MCLHFIPGFLVLPVRVKFAAHEDYEDIWVPGIVSERVRLYAFSSLW
jgi:hypothetical protein